MTRHPSVCAIPLPQSWRDPKTKKSTARAATAGIEGALVYILIRLGWLAFAM